MEIVKNSRGGPKLLYNGYSYVQKKGSKSTKRWGCSQYSTFKCKGSLTTDLAGDKIKSTTEHTHPPQNEEVVKMVADLTERASKSREKTSTILTQAVLQTQEDVRADLPKMETLRRRIRRLKRGNY